MLLRNFQEKVLSESIEFLILHTLMHLRYADFIVNEILPSGDVVHLTTLHPSKSNVSPNKGPNDNPPATDDLKFTKDKPYPAANGEHTEKEKDIKPVDGGEETETPDGLKSSNDAIYAGSEPHQAPNEEHTEKEKDSKSTNDGQGGEVPDNLNVDRKETSDPSHPETAALAKWEESRDKTEVQVSKSCCPGSYFYNDCIRYL